MKCVSGDNVGHTLSIFDFKLNQEVRCAVIDLPGIFKNDTRTRENSVLCDLNASGGQPDEQNLGGLDSQLRIRTPKTYLSIIYR